MVRLEKVIAKKVPVMFPPFDISVKDLEGVEVLLAAFSR